MPSISGRVSIAAASSSQPLTGSQYELAPYDATIVIGLMSSRDLTTCSIFSGPDILAEPGSFVPWTGVAGTIGSPKYPDDYHWEDEVARGDRLKINLTNGDAANAAVVNWVLRITPA